MRKHKVTKKPNQTLVWFGRAVENAWDHPNY